MKTWVQLARIAKAQGFRLVHGSHSATLISREESEVVATVTWWLDDKRKRDAMLRAMIEAALGSGK